jgi:hypothetical protein
VQEPIPMLVRGFAPGSFEVELESAEQSNLLGDSKAGRVLQEFVALANYGPDDPRLIERLRELEAPATEKFLDFLKSVTGSVTAFELEWISPNERLGGSVHMESDRVNAMIAAIEREEIRSKSIIQVMGKLTLCHGVPTGGVTRAGA